MSKEEIIAAIKESAQKLGRAPKYAELLNTFPAAKMGAIRKYLGTYTQALRESGMDCLGAGSFAPSGLLHRRRCSVET